MALLVATSVLEWMNRSGLERRLLRNLPLVAAVPLIFFPSLAFIRNETLYRKQRLSRYRRVHALVVSSEPKDIYKPDFRWSLRLRYYFNYPYPRKMYEYGGALPPHPSDAYLVFARSFFGPDSESSVLLKSAELPLYALTPPNDWVLLLSFEDEGTGHPVDVYWVPPGQYRCTHGRWYLAPGEGTASACAELRPSGSDAARLPPCRSRASRKNSSSPSVDRPHRPADAGPHPHEGGYGADPVALGKDGRLARSFSLPLRPIVAPVSSTVRVSTPGRGCRDPGNHAPMVS